MTKKKMMFPSSKRLVLQLLFLLNVLHSYAQSFEWEAPVSKPDSSGWYHILIGPEISGRLNSAFSDIRIYDAASTEVPYLLREEQAFFSKRIFRPYTIVSRTSKKGCCTDLVLHNPGKNRISNLSLFIRNSDVRKRMRLSGSDDNRNWYVIREDYQISGVYSDSGTTEVKMLDFPLSNYEYYQLSIDDSTSSPVNVISAGYYTTYEEIGNYTELPSPALFQTDSQQVKRTYLKVTLDAPYNIDRIMFSIDGPSKYMRNATLVLPDAAGKPGRESISGFRLNSSTANQVDIKIEKQKVFYVIIENGDDRPLKIKGVSCFQLTRYLAALFDKDKDYVLKFGNSKLGYPQYDVEYFRDSIPQNIPLAAIMPVRRAAGAADDAVAEKSWKDNALIWTAIIAVVLLLGFMTMKMMREMRP